MGGNDKVWTTLGDAPLLARSLCELAPLARAVVLVVRADRVEQARQEIGRLMPAARIIAGGKERQDSVRHGIEALPDADIIAVHDAARPLVTADLLSQGIALVDRYDGAIPVLPVHDTVRRVAGDDTARETVDRAALRMVQTPQTFRAGALRDAYRQAAVDGYIGTDEASLVERVGGSVVTYPGSGKNFKITTDFDLRLAQLLVEGGA